MKGHLRNNLYASQNYLAVIFVTTLILAFCVSVEVYFYKSCDLLSSSLIVVWVSSFLICCEGVKQDELSSYNKFEKTLPLSKYDIITARYLAFVGFFIFLLFCSSLMVLIVYLTKQPIIFDRLEFAMVYGIIGMFVCPAIIHPLALKYGTSKLSIYFFMAMFATLSLLISPLNNFLKIIVAIISFTISYFISLNIYSKKEF